MTTMRTYADPFRPVGLDRPPMSKVICTIGPRRGADPYRFTGATAP